MLPYVQSPTYQFYIFLLLASLIAFAFLSQTPPPRRRTSTSRLSRSITEISRGLSLKNVDTQALQKYIADNEILQKAELYATAFLSMTDMITDVAITFTYFGRGANFYGWASSVCVSVNLLIQTVFIAFQYKDRGKPRQFLEQVFLWTLTRPGVGEKAT